MTFTILSLPRMFWLSSHELHCILIYTYLCLSIREHDTFHLFHVLCNPTVIEIHSLLESFRPWEHPSRSGYSIITKDAKTTLLLCFSHSDVSGWTIQLGITRRQAHAYYGQKVKVRRVVPHPQYNLGVAHDNDIALFQVTDNSSTPAIFSRINTNTFASNDGS